MAALVSGENLPIKLYVDKTAEKEDFSGNIKITGLDIDTTVKDKLKKLGIRILAEDTGLNYGRTVEFYPETGDFIIKSVGKLVKTI